MIVHKLLTGDGAEMYLPYAMSRITYLRRAFKGVVQQTYLIGDVTIRVLVNNYTDRHFIRVDVRAGSYDFYTANVRGSEATAFDHQPTDTSGWITGVNSTGSRVRRATSEGDLKKAKKLSDGAGEYWRYNTPLLDTMNRQKNPQRFWYPYRNGKLVRREIVGSAQGWDQSFSTFAVPVPFPTGMRELAEFGDVGEDVGVTFFDKRKAANFFVETKQPAWLRRGCTQVVEHEEYGLRKFAIVTDALGNFMVAPLDEVFRWDYSEGSFPEEKIKRVSANDYSPEGMIVPSPETSLASFEKTMTSSRMEKYPEANGVTGLWNSFVKIEAPDDFGWGNQLSKMDVQYDKASGYTDQHEYDKNTPIFHFSSDGKKAVTIVNHEWCEPQVVSQSLDYTEGPAHYPFGHKYRSFQAVWAKAWEVSAPYKYETERPWFEANGAIYHANEYVQQPLILTDGIYQKHKAVLDDKYKVRPRKMTSRALLELSIEISVTGEGPMDFSVAITRKQYKTDHHYVCADYAYGNKLNEEKDTELDDLIVAYLANYWSNGPFEQPTFEYSQNVRSRGTIQTRLVVNNLRTENDVLNIRISEGVPQTACFNLGFPTEFPGSAVRYEIDELLEESHAPHYGTATDNRVSALTNGTSVMNLRLSPATFLMNGGAGGSVSDTVYCALRRFDLRALAFSLMVMKRGDAPSYEVTAGEIVVAYGDVVHDSANLFQTTCATNKPEGEPIPFTADDPSLISFMDGLIGGSGTLQTDPGVAPASNLIYYNYWPLLMLKQFDSAVSGNFGCFETHPDGHFAVFTPAFTSELRFSDFYQDREPLLKRSDMADMIWFRLRSEEWKKTSHLEAFNKAWKKELTVDDTFTMPATLDGVDQYQLVGWSAFRTIAPDAGNYWQFAEAEEAE